MSLFELHDIKRDRVPYTSDYLWHLPIWSPQIDNTPFLNLRNTMLASVMATLMVEPVNHVWNSMKLLNLAYEWPKTNQGWNIFMRETFKIPYFWSTLWKKCSFGALQATMDYGMRLSNLHYWWGGTWSPTSLSDFNSLKYLVFSFFSAATICWTGIPFEVARKAYFADQTWPAELRKGYRSPFHALCKIPFVEGPLYLFRGGFPVYCGNTLFSGWAFYMYTWLKNKTFFFVLYNEINYNWVKFCNLNVSFAIGSIFGYPFYQVKNMMELWPKERGGHCTFEGSYWNAAKWVRQNFEYYNTNLYTGYWHWFRTKGIIFYLAMWYGDNFGVFTNYMTDVNTLENIVGEDESD